MKKYATIIGGYFSVNKPKFTMIANLHTSLKLSSILLLLLFLVLGCNNSAHKTKDTSKSDSIKKAAPVFLTLSFKSKKDSSEIRLRADSLFSLLNKALIKKEAPKSWLQTTAETSDQVSKIGENWKSILVLLGSAFVTIVSWFGRKKNKDSGEKENPLFDVVLLISAATFAGLLIYELLVVFGAVVGYITQLIGYAILILPAYWYVYIQQKNAENKCCADELTTREIVFGNQRKIVYALISENEILPRVHFYFKGMPGYVEATRSSMEIVINEMGIFFSINDPKIKEQLMEQLKFWFIEICNNERRK